MPDRAFFDTNVLVYAHDMASPEKKIKSQQILFECLRRNTAVISAQVLSEFFVTVTQKVEHPMTPDRARQEIVLLSVMETVEIDATLVMDAVDLKIRWQLSYWDSLILAAAERAGCSTIYSEDMSNGQVYGSVTVRNPYLD